MTRLRHLSLHVEEPTSDAFFWTLMESADDTAVWIQIETALNCEPTWKRAWNAGMLAYHMRVLDDRVGPRAPLEELNA